ncbi:hypothetical protein AB5I41_22135 [Sphingomonas sp. MMS24-JH45]
MTPERLARLHRVRTLQLGLAQADEARAREGLASETALANRIATLAAVAPTADRTGATGLAAAAHYRDRLHRSADAASNRVRAAEAAAERVADATKTARRDQSAVEKLMARADAVTIAAEIRALQDAPPTAKRKRHDPC